MGVTQPEQSRFKYVVTLGIIFMTMLVGDVLAALTTGEIAHGHGLLAGCFDGGRDVCSVLSGGETMFVIVKEHLGLKTVLALVALVAASLIGTAVGTQLVAALGG